jgi:hypothetical protein
MCDAKADYNDACIDAIVLSFQISKDEQRRDVSNMALLASRRHPQDPVKI